MAMSAKESFDLNIKKSSIHIIPDNDIKIEPTNSSFILEGGSDDIANLKSSPP